MSSMLTELILFITLVFVISKKIKRLRNLEHETDFSLWSK